MDGREPRAKVTPKDCGPSRECVLPVFPPLAICLWVEYLSPGTCRALGESLPVQDKPFRDVEANVGANTHRVMLLPLPDLLAHPSGRYEGHVGYCVDVTERRERAERLAAASVAC